MNKSISFPKNRFTIVTKNTTNVTHVSDQSKIVMTVHQEQFVQNAILTIFCKKFLIKRNRMFNAQDVEGIVKNVNLNLFAQNAKVIFTLNMIGVCILIIVSMERVGLQTPSKLKWT